MTAMFKPAAAKFFEDQLSLFPEQPAPVPATPVSDVRGYSEKVADALLSIKQAILDGWIPCSNWSGGKDSSVLLALCFKAIEELKAEGFDVPMLHILHSDTLIENPYIKAYNQHQIRQIRAYAEASGIAAKVWVASPGLSNDYLVSLIGGRTIASVGSNSKCQQLMKAAPLQRLRSQVKRFVAEQQGIKPRKVKTLALIGTRFDESVQRGVQMRKRGESTFTPVESPNSKGEFILSPIAELTAFDVFEFIGHVRSGKFATYDSFDKLVEVYREMNQGDCMVTVYMAGKEAPRAPCSARTGCWGCLRVSRDQSAENLIASDNGEFLWMKPLNDLREFIKKMHFNPSARCWLGRSVDADGMVSISPNAYSPAYTKQLLEVILTIQAREGLAARKLGIKPRFKILTLKQVMAVDLLWSRYGYQAPFTALRTYIDIYQHGKRYNLPDIASMPEFTSKDVAFSTRVPFTDDSYHHPFNGLRNIDWAAAGAEEVVETASGKLMTDVVTGDEFDIDDEGLAMFVEFEMERALTRISIDDAPSSAAHYLLGLGTVQLAKGKHQDWDRMFRMSNRVHRAGLRQHLHDPHALIKAIEASNTEVAN